MDKVIDQSLKDSPVGIVRQIEAVVWHLHPSAHGVVLDEIHAIFQKQHKIGTMLHGADGIIFIKSRPTGTEDARLEYGAVVNEQQSGIGQFSVRSHQPERFQILVVPFLMRLFAERISKDDERVLACVHLRGE